MASHDDVKKSALSLNQHLSQFSWMVSVGSSTEGGLPVLMVYIKKSSARVRAQIPEHWEGLPVRIRAIGNVRPA